MTATVVTTSAAKSKKKSILLFGREVGLFLCIVGSFVDFIQERLNPWILCFLIMNEIRIAAQQLVIDSIKKISFRPGWLSSDETCQVCTHDKFEDYLFRTSVKLATVFPSFGSIRRTLKSYKDESFSFEAVFASSCS